MVLPFGLNQFKVISFATGGFFYGVTSFLYGVLIVSIRVRCNGCKKSLSVDDSLAGTRGKCPNCDSVIVVPEVELPPVTLAEPPVAADKTNLQPPKAPVILHSINAMGWIILGALVLLLGSGRYEGIGMSCVAIGVVLKAVHAFRWILNATDDMQ